MWSRAAAGLLLLALTAHAFVASTAHFHHLASPGPCTAQAALRGGDERGRSAPLAGDEKQCLLCRLQRNLVSDVQHAAIVVAPPPAWALGYDALRDVPARAARTLLRPGRAPPSTRV